MVAVVNPPRPDDASGTAFRIELEGLRQTRPPRSQPIPLSDLSVEWEIEMLPISSPALREAWGFVCEYELYVVEMRDEDIVHAPPQMPKISWSIREPVSEDWMETLTGGPAPTFKEAILRAEIAARVRLGVVLDG